MRSRDSETHSVVLMHTNGNVARNSFTIVAQPITSHTMHLKRSRIQTPAALPAAGACMHGLNTKKRHLR